MSIQVESYGHAVILNLKGDLAEDTLGAFSQEVDRQLEGKEVVDIVLNMEAVTFVDSQALEALLDLQDRLAERLGQVRLVKCQDNVAKILEITALDSVFESFDDVNEAVKALET